MPNVVGRGLVKAVEQTESPSFLTFSQILVHEVDVPLREFYRYVGCGCTRASNYKATVLTYILGVQPYAEIFISPPAKNDRSEVLSFMSLFLLVIQTIVLARTHTHTHRVLARVRAVSFIYLEKVARM